MTVRIEIADLHMLNANELRNLINYLGNTLEDAEGLHQDESLRLDNEFDSDEEDIREPVGIKTDTPVSYSVEQPLIRGNHLNIVDIELDSEGLPWDKRIHSMNKTKTKTGAWKLARNMTDAAAAKVKNELRKTMAAQSELKVVELPVETPVTHAPIETPVVKEIETVSPAEQFQKFIAKLLNLQKNNIVKAADVTNILQTLGLKTIVELSHKPELISSADMMLDNIVNYEGGDDE